MTFTERTLDELTLDDEASFRHVGLYADLKKVLRVGGYRFRVLPEAAARWDHALLLSLTFWGDGSGDVLVDDTLPADVVTHVAWHHLAAKELADPGTQPGAEALFLGEAIASAFDVYLVGRLLSRSPQAAFLETQVPAMVDAAEAAGVTEAEFGVLLQAIAADPDRAFEDLRQLLFDTTTALFACVDAQAALAVLVAADAHRFGCLLYRYELSNWVLYARAHAGPSLAPDARVRGIDQALRQSPVALDWLTVNWVEPAIR